MDSTGNVTYTAKYDVYGALRGSTGSSNSKHKFCGQLGHATESDTGGLIYMRARWMDPATGRFISEDPSKDGMNWYAYCDNNPVNYVDVTGRKLMGYAEVVAYALAKYEIGGAQYAVEMLRDLADTARALANAFGDLAAKRWGVAAGEEGLGGSLNADADLGVVEGSGAFLAGVSNYMTAYYCEFVAALIEGGCPLGEL